MAIGREIPGTGNPDHAGTEYRHPHGLASKLSAIVAV
jgi:hypothetical protein